MAAVSSPFRETDDSTAADQAAKPSTATTTPHARAGAIDDDIAQIQRILQQLDGPDTAEMSSASKRPASTLAGDDAVLPDRSTTNGSRMTQSSSDARFALLPAPALAEPHQLWHGPLPPQLPQTLNSHWMQLVSGSSAGVLPPSPLASDTQIVSAFAAGSTPIGLHGSSILANLPEALAHYPRTGEDIHPSERAHIACPECGQEFIQASSLRDHVAHVHKDAKPFRCVKCGKGFTEMGHLRVHTRSVHEGKRPHSCALCNRVFATGSNLRTHIRVVHPIVHPAPGQGHVQEHERQAEAARVAADAKKKPRRSKTARQQGDHLSAGLNLPPPDASPCAQALHRGQLCILDALGNERRVGNYLCLTCGGAYGSLGTVRTHSKREHGIEIEVPGSVDKKRDKKRARAHRLAPACNAASEAVSRPRIDVEGSAEVTAAVEAATSGLQPASQSTATPTALGLPGSVETGSGFF